MCIDCFYSSTCPQCGKKGDPNDLRGGRRTECCPTPEPPAKQREPKTGNPVTRKTPRSK